MKKMISKAKGTIGEIRKPIVLGLVILSLLLIAGCAKQPGIIGGQRDENGCLGPAGYSWNASIGACVREWELDESQRKAAQIVMAPMNARPITVVEVETLRCVGCFNVKIQYMDNAPTTVKLVNWTIIYDESCGECPMLSTPAPGWCDGGTILDGGKDECGCQRAPRCSINIVGNDRDEHGCIGSAGYSWCESKQKCLRTWEEDCAEQKACTEEAKICPDGSAVGRTGPDCEFAPCPNGTGIANPASTFCISQGGESKIITAADGSQSGVCKFKDGTTCDEWAYFRGECPARHVCTATEKAAEACTMEYAPVCGDDGVTYGNKCSACASGNIDSWTSGECAASGKNTCSQQMRGVMCTMEYTPVCGWFDESIKCFKYPCAMTYSNACSACSNENVASWTEGECPK